MKTERNKLYVNEYFESISGEGITAGKPCWFLRLSGCNLSCRYCDTPHHNKYKVYQIDDLVAIFYDYISESYKRGIKMLIITGGEPLLQRDALGRFIDSLQHTLIMNDITDFQVRIETNGTQPRLDRKYFSFERYSMDFKLPSAFSDLNEWEKYADLAMKNIETLIPWSNEGDEVKMVVDPDNNKDIDAMRYFFDSSDWDRVSIQPVWGKDMSKLVSRLRDEKFFGQLLFRGQLHKIFGWR